MSGKLSAETNKALAEYKDSSPATLRSLQSAVLQDLNNIVKKQVIYDPKEPKRFAGITISERSPAVRSRAGAPGAGRQEVQGEDRSRFNRMLLRDAYPQRTAFSDGILCISDKFAATLASVGFICFLIGRFTGAGLLKKYSAHKMLGLYGLLNVLVCLLIFLQAGLAVSMRASS